MGSTIFANFEDFFYLKIWNNIFYKKSKIYYINFAWQKQYLVRLEGDFSW